VRVGGTLVFSAWAESVFGLDCLYLVYLINLGFGRSLLTCSHCQVADKLAKRPQNHSDSVHLFERDNFVLPVAKLLPASENCSAAYSFCLAELGYVTSSESWTLEFIAFAEKFNSSLVSFYKGVGGSL